MVQMSVAAQDQVMVHADEHGRQDQVMVQMNMADKTKSRAECR